MRLKDKLGSIHTSLDDFSSQVSLSQQNSRFAWYSTGAGVLFYKGACEVGVNYELQLDREYVGHQGSVKLRWNF
jgi:hypothetical protein